MENRTMLSERPRGVQIVLAAVVPFVFGAVVGVALGTSAGLYWGLSALAAVGGVLAGLEHEDVRSGARRGLLGGALFAAGILIVHAIGGAEEKVSLGSFPPLLIVIDAVIGMLLGMLGARLGRRKPDPSH
jgi:NO-binding membrane sensor protein with MHYT domain